MSQRHEVIQNVQNKLELLGLVCLAQEHLSSSDHLFSAPSNPDSEIAAIPLQK